MPTLQLQVDPVGNGQHLSSGSQLRACAEGRGDEMADQLGIESISGQAQTLVPDHPAGGRLARGKGWPDPQERKVACTTSEIADHDQFVVL